MFGLNAWMLLGLAGLAIPILIHLLNRRRFDVVDWGAMQFLKISETTRRRILIEEVLLMMMRMGIIALMVLALAAPYLISPWLSKFMASAGGRPNRDVVIVIDGSYSMGFTGAEQTPHEKAKEWALNYLRELGPGDNVAILQAKQQVVKVVGEPTADLEKAREAVRKLPEPRGGVNWPQALNTALEILRPSRRPIREIVVLGDGQRVGWCDANNILRWELMAQNLPDENPKPNVWVVNVNPERKTDDPPNWSLTPLRATRAVASVGQRVRFRTSLQFTGQKGKEIRPPYRLRLEIDGGREKEILDFPKTDKQDAVQLPLDNITYAFKTPGSHLVSVIVEPDAPKNEQAPGYSVKDELPGDNRQDISIEVVQALPVLLVDGDTKLTPGRGTYFLQAALSPAGDPTPSVLARQVPITAFTADDLKNNVDKDRPGSRPRVLVLQNVPRLNNEQQQAVVNFLNEGGSVLVTLGERVDSNYYNEQLFKGGEGWLPAKLDDKVGSEVEEDKAIHVLLTSFYHPALEPFRETKDLTSVTFPRRWRVAAPPKNSAAAAIALLSDDQPWMVERSFGQGRVILSVVPFDNTWRTKLSAHPAFIPLVHELVYYLAGARATDFNVRPGQPLRYRPGRDETPAPITVQPPEGEVKTLPPTPWPPTFDETRETGVYVLKTADDRSIYYVVQPDLAESDLSLSKPEDREQVTGKLANKVKVIYEDDREKVIGGDASPPKMELWWLFLIGVTLLLCGEVWMTRRIALSR
jgi:hypothetical protein